MLFGARYFSQLIASAIEKQVIILKVYDKVVTITCDGSSNMCDRFTYFSRQNIIYIRCIAHKLHLIIYNSLNTWVSSKKK